MLQALRLTEKAKNLFRPKIKTKFYSRNEFLKIIEWEKNRCEEDRLPLTNLIIDLKKCNIDSMAQYQHFIKQITALIEKSTRKNDIKCFFNQTQINILLINTSIVYGHLVQTRFHDALTTYFSNKKDIFQSMIQEIQYYLQPVVFAFETQDEKQTTWKFNAEKETENSIAINY